MQKNNQEELKQFESKQIELPFSYCGFNKRYTAIANQGKTIFEMFLSGKITLILNEKGSLLGKAEGLEIFFEPEEDGKEKCKIICESINGGLYRFDEHRPPQKIA